MEKAPTHVAPPSRARRALELVYEVEGVGAARVWMWSGRAAVAVRGTGAITSQELLRRVEAAVVGLREAGETWDFGVLQDDRS